MSSRSRRADISNARGWTAERALRDARAELAGVVAEDDQHYNWLLAHRVLEADDQCAIREGMVSQADHLLWSTLDGLYDLALYGHLMHQQMLHPVVDGERRCDLCHVGERFLHTALHDPITTARGETATVLSNRMEDRVVTELNRRLNQQ